MSKKNKDTNITNSTNVYCTLSDKSFNSQEIKAKVECSNQSIYIMPEGYGDCCSENGHGCPVMIEVWKGQLRVVVWSDINDENPTHIISLDDARESLRKVD